MTSRFNYVLPVEQTGWKVNDEVGTTMTWDYDIGRERILRLYDKGKRKQWNSSDRIDWTQDLDPENPMLLPDQHISIFGSDIWNKMTTKEKSKLRHHIQAWQISQFLHGEQGALICAAKIVQQIPDMDSKYYAATQVIDEARHVEVYSRLLQDKFEMAYPITPPLVSLLENVIQDKRWDFTNLGMQVLIEGLALASFQQLRDMSKNNLVSSINAYVMEDEARHVAFGRIALREVYPQLTESERAEREEFVIDCCYYMRDRMLSGEQWEIAGLPKNECIEIAKNSSMMKHFRARLFSRIVPTVKDIGLWSKKVQAAFEDMGVLEFSNINAETLLTEDESVAAKFDAKQQEIENFANTCNEEDTR